MITSIGSFILLVPSTVLGIFQTVMKTVRLDVRQWLICAAVALSIEVAAEMRKAVLRRTTAGRSAKEVLDAERTAVLRSPLRAWYHPRRVMWRADRHVSVLADGVAVFSVDPETSGVQEENDR